jgi:transposase
MLIWTKKFRLIVGGEEMLKMEGYEYIRYSYFNLGKSIKSISRESGISRPTIRKAIRGIEPKYLLSKTKNKPVMGEYEETIKHWLEKDKGVPIKQRHTAKRIYDRLREECKWRGSESSVRKLVRRIKEDLNIDPVEGFIPSDPSLRQGAEVDWGEAYIREEGVKKKAYMFCMRSRYSGKPFVRLYSRMAQECFFDGHIKGFAYFGGVFSEIIYDNLTSAVKQILKGRNRLEQEAFIKIRAHYAYQAVFCNPARGWEKGGVEGLVGFARRNFLTPVPECKSLEELNQILIYKCEKRSEERTHGQRKTIGELAEEEKKHLQLLPKEPYNNYQLINSKVNKYLTVQIVGNYYSVPEKYVGKKVEVELGLNDLRITFNNKLIASHERKFTRGEWAVNPWHYMQLLCKKPEAFPNSRISVAITSYWPKVVQRLWDLQVAKHGRSEGTKEFLETLVLFKNRTESEMVTVLQLAIENGTYSKECIAILLSWLLEENIKVEEANVSHIRPIADFTIPQPDVEKFDKLLGVPYDQRTVTNSQRVEVGCIC